MSSSVTAAPRRARSRRDEVVGSGLSAAMAVAFAVVVILGKEAQGGALPFVMLAVRFGGQSVLLFALILVVGRPLLPAPGERLPLALASMLGYGTESALYFSALNHGSAAAITLLFYLYPVWVMLASVVLERRAPAGHLFLALVLALVGSAIVVTGTEDPGGVPLETLGIVLALLTSFAYTAYLVATDRFVRRTDPMTAAAWLGAGASVANVVFAVSFGAVASLQGSRLALVGMCAISAVAFVCMLGGLQRVGAVRNAIIGVMEPLTVAVLAAAFLDEAITWPVVVGGSLILVGAVLAALVRGATHATPEPPVV